MDHLVRAKREVEEEANVQVNRQDRNAQTPYALLH